MVEKKVIIKLIGEAQEEYLKLEQTVREEIQKGAHSFNETLLNSIKAKADLLKANYDYGDHVPKNLIPRKYRLDYGVTNLYVVDLAGYWRLIYTIKQTQRDETQIEIITIYLDILDLIDHKKYDKIFGYKKK